MKINGIDIKKDVVVVVIGIVLCSLVAGFVLGLGVLALIQG